MAKKAVQSSRSAASGRYVPSTTEKRGGYASGKKPISAMKPPPPGPASGGSRPSSPQK